jgi:hypothetical protein
VRPRTPFNANANANANSSRSPVTNVESETEQRQPRPFLTRRFPLAVSARRALQLCQDICGDRQRTSEPAKTKQATATPQGKPEHWRDIGKTLAIGENGETG